MAEDKNYLDIGFNNFLQQEGNNLDYLLGSATASGVSQNGATGQEEGVSEPEIKDGSSLADLWITNSIKSKDWKPKTTGFYLNGQTGYAEFSDIYVSGEIEATVGTIGGFDIGADYIRDAANSFGLSANVTGGDDIRFWAGDTYANRATADFRITEAGAVTGSSITITGGAISGVPISSIPNSTVTDISLLECSHDLVFSVTDADTIAWALGTIVFSNGRTFSISAGNTGNMEALTYIYLDPAVSSTVLQTTTIYSTAMGANKRLIGTAQNHTVTASFIPYGAGVPLIDGANIGALSIIAGNIAASTITSGKLSVSQLSAIAADMGTITAGSISVVNGANTIGLAPSGSNAIFSGTTGSPEFKVTPAGDLTATSGTIGGWTMGSTTLKSAANGERIELDAGNKRINLINSTGNTVSTLFYGTTTTAAIFKIAPTTDARRGLEFVVGSALGADAKCITIDNPSTSISIDITDGGSTGINIVGCSTSAISITHSGTAAALVISAGGYAPSIDVTGGAYPAIELVQNGNSTNSYGIRITQGTDSLKGGILIDNNAASHLCEGITIDRDGAADNEIIRALRIECANTGANNKACGIDFTGATIPAIMNVAVNTGLIDTYAGRIPIYVAGTLKYLAYYNY